VVALARRLGERLGLDEDELEPLAWGAYLHDIGKIAIADAVLLKPGPLDAEEHAEVMRHAVIGHDMTRDLTFLPERSRDVVRSHHERWDGSGYPDGLAGTAIPRMARLFALVDVYDALVSERPYKPAWSVADASAELAASAGTQFDPELTAAMLELLQEEPTDDQANRSLDR
jgi:HD-GYP domain-containing protein (c-di-GMP phosphodiesterase class II)